VVGLALILAALAAASAAWWLLLHVGALLGILVIVAGLIQGWRDREAHVTLVHAATHDIELTVAEAAELAEALTDCVRQATGQQ
jgi:hypothetical protein